MSDIKIQPSATGSATVTLTAPATSTARTVTLPDSTGTLLASEGAVVVNESGADVDFRVESDNDANALFVQGSDGNVGINNSAPTQRLEINGNSQLNAHDNPSGSGGYFTTKGMQIGNAFDAGLSGGDDDRNAIVWNERGTSLLLGTNNIERMRIDYNGNVGIGVTPEGWHSNYKALQIGNTGTLFKDNVNGGDFSIGNNFYLNSTPAYAYTTTAEASRYSQENGVHYFQVAPSGSADAAISWTTALEIKNDGDIYHSDYAGNKGIWAEVVANGVQTMNKCNTTGTHYHYFFQNGNGTVGNIQSNGSSTAYNTSSDYRLKENVDYTWDATTRLKQLKPARFNFIADDTNTLVDGFIAHEVSSVVPEAVSGEKDAMTEEVLYVEGDDIPEGKSVGDVKTAAAINPQGIDQSKLVPLLVKTIQELEARITALEA